VTESPWQPIETFPRTCVPVLWTDGFRYRVANWTLEMFDHPDGTIVCAADMEELEEGIAWMAIPALPSTFEQPRGRPFASAP
jgi:hypothetical protein